MFSICVRSYFLKMKEKSFLLFCFNEGAKRHCLISFVKRGMGIIYFMLCGIKSWKGALCSFDGDTK